MEVLGQFNGKIRETRAQCLIIRDLIEGLRGNSDDWNFQRVLQHWHEANEHFLKKYPEDYVVS